MFNRFYNRVVITAQLQAKTALYIGAGQNIYSPSAVQNPLLKNALGQPYIPGSSLKGVLRSFLESIAQNDESSCFVGKKCSDNFSDLEKRKKHLEAITYKYQNNLHNTSIEEIFAEDVFAKSCIACRLFGNTVMAGKVKISDASLLKEQSIMAEIRTGNAIDRDSKTAIKGALFDCETIPAGTVFEMKIIAENLTSSEANYLAKLMQYFAEGGLIVGGKSRSGLGHVGLENIKVICTKAILGAFPETVKIEIDDNSELAHEVIELMKECSAQEPKEAI